MTVRVGNILGELMAESDTKMLDEAFLATRSYQSLLSGSDFRFVVGRRGAGKSALFLKLSEDLRKRKRSILLKERPQEEKALAFQSEIERLTKAYTEARRITRLTWRVQVLTETLEGILADYKANRLQNLRQIQDYRSRHAELFLRRGMDRSLHALRLARKHYPDADALALPEQIADHFEIKLLESMVFPALTFLGLDVYYLYDGLDEGWTPTPLATGVLGGLAKAAAEFKESGCRIHCLLFIRDNMMRALSQLDGDYTRNIEGNVLRLQWDETALLALVARRLRAAFGWTDEQDIRVWNKFAHRGLEGREGFQTCLKLTLYRPRDVIALLNMAFQEAGSHGRDRIIDSDLEGTATRISRTRLEDLSREYDRVLPGLPELAESFRGCETRLSFDKAKEIIDTALSAPQPGRIARDFCLLKSSEEGFHALYSVGFLGILDGDHSARFCHDGSNTDIQALSGNQEIVIHPCYWRALDISSKDSSGDYVSVRIDDEDDLAVTLESKEAIRDFRFSQLGKAADELDNIPLGKEGAHRFEEWVYATVGYLFALGLENIQWKPNPGAIQQRDIVGRVTGTRGFWRHVGQHHSCSQFIVECKNYEDMSQEEFRQAWSYLCPPYGRCLLIITRASTEKPNETEKALIREGWSTQERKLVILMPAILLQRALRKMRSGKEKRDDYTEKLLASRLDTFERSYIAQNAPAKRTKKAKA